jgi:hypothetical protein
MNAYYCYKKCPIGIEAQKKFLDENESVFDTILDFKVFADECYKTCPYKEEHDKFTAEENK